MTTYDIDPESGDFRDKPEPPSDEETTELREKETARRYAVLSAKQRYRDMGVPECHNRIITPESDPQRFTSEEKFRFFAGWCTHMTAYGLPWTEWCPKRLLLGATMGLCAEHEAELLEEYCPDGSKR